MLLHHVKVNLGLELCVTQNKTPPYTHERLKRINNSIADYT